MFLGMSIKIRQDKTRRRLSTMPIPGLGIFQVIASSRQKESQIHRNYLVISIGGYHLTEMVFIIIKQLVQCNKIKYLFCESRRTN